MAPRPKETPLEFRRSLDRPFRGITQERRERPFTAFAAIDSPPPMIYYAPNMKDVEYSDDKYVLYRKLRQRGRRNFCIGIIVIALVTLGAMLVLWK